MFCRRKSIISFFAVGMLIMSSFSFGAALSKKTSYLAGSDIVAVANKKATQQPISTGYTGSIMNFNYSPGALYEVYCAPLNVTDIQLHAQEHVTAVAAGDTTRWQVLQTFSGSGEKRCEHLLVKPIASDISTTLVITTDQRTYHLNLYSKDKTYMPIVAWRYVDDVTTSLNNGVIEDPEPNVDFSHLNFNYKVKLTHGPRPEWFPIAVFNDSNKTYIRLPKKTQEAPTLFLGTDEDNGQIINYRVIGNYYIVDALFAESQLRGGPNNQIIVQISYVRKK